MVSFSRSPASSQLILLSRAAALVGTLTSNYLVSLHSGSNPGLYPVTPRSAHPGLAPLCAEQLLAYEMGLQWRSEGVTFGRRNAGAVPRHL